ncbi:hypothetical protein D7S89_15560 [Trinickia fusca]|uniref:Uncharacterized protein n=1 Tax=Trinickia fusca TaxID=2419777 RepID=A0A494XHJ6_9BURK|nr:hypothetical protein D7S89_15560 [Trinickia fusca]
MKILSIRLVATQRHAKPDITHWHFIQDMKMKLVEYIKHLQALQEKYEGLDIEVAQLHPRTRTDAGLYVIPAKAPVIWPAEAEADADADASNLSLVRRDALPLDPATKPKGSGPDGVIIVLDVN